MFKYYPCTQNLLHKKMTLPLREEGARFNRARTSDGSTPKSTELV